MNGGYTPTIHVELYPQSYLNVDKNIKNELEKNNISMKDYDSYIATLFETREL